MIVHGVLLWIVYIFLGPLCEGAPNFNIAWSENSTGPLIRSKMALPPGRKNSVNNIIIRFFNGTTPEEMVSVKLPNSHLLLDIPGFSPAAPTVLYIHGYIELYTDASVQTVVSAYLQGKPEYNLLVLDWSNLAYGQYISSAPNVKKVGLAAARQLTLLGLGSLHIVGTSLGSHIAGYIGRSMKRAGRQVDRITALDPALPGFYPALLATPLRRTDARFTDSIHTDAGKYGAAVSDSHAHFWPNGGSGTQPGCPLYTIFFSLEDFCSHFRAWQLWSESVLSGRGAFPARRCADFPQFQRRACADDAGSQSVYMGHYASESLRGNFYLTTNAETPYSRQL